MHVIILHWRIYCIIFNCHREYINNASLVSRVVTNIIRRTRCCANGRVPRGFDFEGKVTNKQMPLRQIFRNVNGVEVIIEARGNLVVRQTRRENFTGSDNGTFVVTGDILRK